jgi:hypothetical protein
MTDTAPDTAEDLVYCIYADVATDTDGSESLMRDLGALGVDTGTHVSLTTRGDLAIENITDRQYRQCQKLLRRRPAIRVTDIVIPEGVRP